MDQTKIDFAIRFEGMWGEAERAAELAKDLFKSVLVSMNEEECGEVTRRLNAVADTIDAEVGAQYKQATRRHLEATGDCD